jgi:hypothetical protein
MLFFISRNLGKLVKNLKEYKTKLYTSLLKFLPSKSTMTLITAGNFGRVREPIKFRIYLYFRQTVRSANSPFGKMSVRQHVRSAKRPSVGKMSVRQTVRPSWSCFCWFGTPEVEAVFSDSIFSRSSFELVFHFRRMKPPLLVKSFEESAGVCLGGKRK